MFKYFGSKYKSVGAYPVPAFDTIVEPFAGSAAYAVAHRHVKNVLLFEKDKRVVALWRRLLSGTVTELLKTVDPVAGEMSSDLLVAFAAGRTTRDTPERFLVSPRMAQRYRSMVLRIASVLDECRHFKITQGDYTDAPDKEAVWFIDPPYQHRDGRWDRTRGGRYLHANKDIDFKNLARWCLSRRGQVIVCEQDGADWMPWNKTRPTHNGIHGVYGEVWWTNTTPVRRGFFDL